MHSEALERSRDVIDFHMTSVSIAPQQRTVGNHERKQRANAVNKLCSRENYFALNNPTPIRPGSLVLNTTLCHVHNLLLILIHHIRPFATSLAPPHLKAGPATPGSVDNTGCS